MTGGAYCRAVRAVLASFGCEETQQQLARALAGEGARAESAFAARGYEGVLRVLGEAEALAGGQVFAAEESRRCSPKGSRGWKFRSSRSTATRCSSAGSPKAAAPRQRRCSPRA